MKKIFLLIFIFIIFFSCKNKNEAVIINTETTIENKSIEDNLIRINNIKYINSPEGLNLRNGPNLNSEKIITVPNDSPVEILSVNSDPVLIDGIKNNWYLIKFKEFTGWVFGGYLIDELNEVTIIQEEKRNISSDKKLICDMFFAMGDENIGKYYFNSISIIEKNGNVEEYTDKNTGTYFLLDSKGNNQYIMKNYTVIPMPNKDLEITINANYDEEIYSYSGEKGGGHTYIKIYFKENIIIVHIDYAYIDMSNIEGDI